VVDEDGRVLGRHGGYWRFTAGQRRGLGISSARPLHVLRTEPATNRVVVGSPEATAVRSVRVEGRLYAPVARGEVKLRYRSPAVPATVRASKGGFTLDLEEPAHAVALGQAAVVYEDDVVVGAGVITGAS
jgi:tRNA-specific 2-thiouridylase